MATKRVGNITINYTVPEAQTQLYNAIGRNAGTQAAETQNGQAGDNFFVKRGKSIENALGTTGAAIASGIKSGGWLFKGTENAATENLLKDTKTRMNNVAKKFGYNSWSDWQDAYEQARNSGDTNLISQFEQQNKEFQAQANANAEEANRKAANFKDYTENNYVSKKINQDRGKFAGSAINTLSTAADITGLSSTPLTNAIQGGVEGIADELEQNGLNDFDWGRAGQNALIGATTGAVTGALNKGISGALAKQAAAKGVTNAAVKGGIGNAIKQGAKTIGTGAVRGALSGAVGGATGAGLQSALNGVDFGQGVQNALQGAVQGAQQGAITGGIMAGANYGLSKTPGVGKFYNQLQNAKTNWDQSGKNFDERLTNTLTATDENGKQLSAVGDWLMNKRQSKLLNAAGNLGDTIRDYTDQGYGPRKAESKAYEDLIKEYYDERGIEGALEDAQTAGYPQDSNFRKAQRLVEGGALGTTFEDAFNGLKAIYGDDFKESTYLNKDGSWKYKDGEPYVWTIYKNKIAMNLANKLDAMDAGTYSPSEDTPTTAEGWLKKAGQRVVEDLNNKGVGLSIKDVSNEQYPDDINNMEIRDYNVSQNENGPTPSGFDKVTKAFDESTGQRVLTNRDGKDFALGGFGTNNLQRKANLQHNLSETDIKNIIDTSDKQSVSGDSSFRKDNIAWFGDLPNGERGTVITRLNSLGQEEIINAYKNNPGYEAELLAAYGTPAQSRTGSLGLEDLGVESATQGRNPIITQDNYNVNTQDPWDRLAQENGYQNYNEVLRRFAEANPNVEINPRGMAGQVLSWLDENPNTPTTAGEWAKLAGQRLVEDANNSSLGLRVRDVSQDEPSKRLYNALVGKQEPAVTETETFMEENVVPSRTSKEGKLRYARGKELLRQYGTVDQPMARASRAVESVQEIADAGFTKPEDVERMANVITGSNGEVSKLTRNLINSAKPVDTFTGENGQTLDEFVDNSIQLNSLYGTNKGNAVKQTIEANLRSLPSRAEGSVTYTDAPDKVFKVIQNLEASAAELEGRGGSKYTRPSIENIHQAAVLKDTASLLKQRLFDGADVSEALTPEVAQNLKSYDPKNEKYANWVDNTIMNAKSIEDLRAAQAPFVRMSKYIDNAYTQAATVGGRMAENANDLSRILTTRNGLLRAGIDALWNSNTARRGRAAVYDKLADKAANNPTTAAGWAKQAGQRAAEDLGNTNLGNRIQDVNGKTITNAKVASPAELANMTANYDPATQLYNAIGRTEGLSNAEQANTAKYLVDAAQEAEIVPKAEMLEAGQTNAIAESPTLASTNLYNTVTGTTPTTSTQSASTNTGSYFAPTGDYWTDILATAMTSAMNANDATAFMSLYSMYQDALSNNSSQSSGKDYTNPTNWNSSDRTKLITAQNALDQIDQLENAYIEATGQGGSNAVQGWLRSRAADLSGGNWDPSASNYNNLAESIGMSIIKNLINLGVTESDAERYKKYIPSITDTKEQAATKLETLRNIYQNQINNLYSVYGV